MRFKVRFQGSEYLYIGPSLAEGGALTTPERFANFDESCAHLYPDGKVRRHGAVIGTVDEIEVIEEVSHP